MHIKEKVFKSWILCYYTILLGLGSRNGQGVEPPTFSKMKSVSNLFPNTSIHFPLKGRDTYVNDEAQSSPKEAQQTTETILGFILISGRSLTKIDHVGGGESGGTNENNESTNEHRRVRSFSIRTSKKGYYFLNPYHFPAKEGGTGGNKRKWAHMTHKTIYTIFGSDGGTNKGNENINEHKQNTSDCYHFD